MIKTRNTTVEEIDNAVLIYLEKFKRVNEDSFSRLTLFGVNVFDIIKYLKNNQVSEKWGEEFTDKVLFAVNRIYEKNIISFPIIENLSVVDIFIGKMFMKNSWLSLGSTHFFIEPVKMEHIIKYLQRDNEIYTWNADFVYNVNREYARALEFLTGDKTEYSAYFSLLRDSGIYI